MTVAPHDGCTPERVVRLKIRGGIYIEEEEEEEDGLLYR
jgi:hypothetical protein